jgi:hypothetical protein
MKKHLLFLFVLISANIFLFSSCKKNNDPPSKTKTELISQNTWKFKTATVGGTTFTFPSCLTDLILTFATNGTGNLDEGPTKCNATDPQTTTFTWFFQNNETELVTSAPLIPNGSTTFTIVSLTESELVVTFGYSTPGPIINVQATFIH